MITINESDKNNNESYIPSVISQKTLPHIHYYVQVINI